MNNWAKREFEIVKRLKKTLKQLFNPKSLDSFYNMTHNGFQNFEVGDLEDRYISVLIDMENILDERMGFIKKKS